MAKTNKTPDDQANPAMAVAEKVADPFVSEETNGENGNGKLRWKSLIIDGTRYRTQLNKKFESRKAYEIHDPRKVISQIPGSVVKILVKEGQNVRAGEQILVLEAMKMMNLILVHIDGEVKTIHVKEGEKIPKGFLMVELK